jgi:amidase
MDIVYASATDLAAAIRARRVSATEVVAAHLAWIDRVNPALNAVVTLDADRALARARLADEASARGERCGPLHGVPFVLKDAHATAGVRTTVGFPPLDAVPDFDGAVAARLKGAGAILLGKTNVPAMLADFQTDNPLFGRTNNPWDGDRTPGGSSGGAAAAVASGMAPFDVGTDLAGSIRIPAHFCGVFGLKPTEHRVSLHGVIPGLPPPRTVRVMSCVGPLARTVDDLALIHRIIAGPDGHDTDVPPAPVEPVPELELAGLRIAVAPSFPNVPVDAAVRAAVATAAASLERLGATVAEAALPDVDFADDRDEANDLIGMVVGAVRPDGHESAITLGRYFDALDRRDRSRLAWERFLTGWDALLCPAAPTTAFSHRKPGTPLLVDGCEVPYGSVAAHALPFSYSGHPALVMPVPPDPDGLPIGVQLVGRLWGESRLLGVARVVAAAAGVVRRPLVRGQQAPGRGEQVRA